MSEDEMVNLQEPVEEPAKKKSSSKRKRDSDVRDEPELEIDVNAPEPPSKRAKRKEKKKGIGSRLAGTHKEGTAPTVTTDDVVDEAPTPAITRSQTAPDKRPDERSAYGVWIGNLPFTVTKDDVRRFLSEQGEIAETLITRVHMPAPSDGKSKNKGFAYVDFTTTDALDKAIGISEKLLGGRRTLIKNAKSFEGRPEKPKAEKDAPSGKEPTKRIFVGNLSFDVTREDLAEHFAPAGETEDVFLATFEDSGKCKGFGWVRFKEVEAAQAAVKGFVKVNGAGDGGDSDEDSEAEIVTEKDQKRKKSKGKKIFINRINGRPLRCEFAEDAQTRYKKRYGPDRKRVGNPRESGYDATAGAQVDGGNAPDARKPRGPRKGTADDRREDRRKRHDARTIAPGQSLAYAQRASAAIVAGAGKKISFD